MKKNSPAVVTVILFIGFIAGISCSSGSPKTENTDKTEIKKVSADWKITSPAFDDGEYIPDKYTCEGKNVSPPLKWTDPPEGAKSLALIVDDPDAPAGVFTHWLLYSLPPEVKELHEGMPTERKLSEFVNTFQGMNDFKTIGYNGPCPPAGAPHHYHFKLYALDAELNIEHGAKKNELENAMQEHILAKTELTGIYER